MEKKHYVSPTTEAYEIKQNICEFVQSGEGEGAAKGNAKTSFFNFTDSEDDGDGMFRVMSMDE